MDADDDDVQYLRFGDQTGANGPRIFHNDGLEQFFVRATAGPIEIDMDVEVNDDTVQRTAGPVAKGYINYDATIANAVNVANVTWNSSGFYEIELSEDDYYYDEYATSVTGFGNNVSWKVSSSSPLMRVFPSDDSQHDFQFVTHKLIAGEASSSNTDTDKPDHELSEDQIERGDREQSSEDDPEPDA